MYPQSGPGVRTTAAGRLLPLPGHPGGWWREEGPAPSQEALGVGRACGNDFIGKACDIFSPPVCGSWRKLEVVVISVAPAAGSRSREQGTGRGCGAVRSGPSCLSGAWGRLSSCTALADLLLHASSSPSLHPLHNLSGPSVRGGSFLVFLFWEKLPRGAGVTSGPTVACTKCSNVEMSPWHFYFYQSVYF